jgi:predicted NBD/HSP70 family sugar kinase
MAVEQARKRNLNRGRILRTLHFDGPLRRGELGQRLGIRGSSVSNIVSELVSLGLVCERDPGSARSPVRLDTERFHTVTASITADALHLGRVYLDGRTDDVRDVPLKGDSSPERVLEALSGGLDSLLKGRKGTPLGVGVATPGLVDPDSGRVRHAVYLSGWRDVPLGEELSSRLARRVMIDNDVRCQLWACAWFDRLLKESDDILYVGILDGVACSIIARGRRVLGGRHAAGEIGHVRAGDEGRLCKCGKIDCLETYCSVPAILDEMRKIRPEKPELTSVRDIVRAAQVEPAVGNVLDRVVQRLVKTLAPVLAAVDPDVLVIGTDDVDLSGMLSRPMERHMEAELAGMESRRAVVRTAGGLDANTLRGIAGLVVEDSFRTGCFATR